eukprot:gene38055-46961_t
MQFSESITNELVIVDFDVHTVQNLLKYLYTDEFNADLTMLQALDLIAIGDKYQIENIQQDCERFMEGKSSENSQLVDSDDEKLDNIVDSLPTIIPARENLDSLDIADIEEQDAARKVSNTIGEVTLRVTTTSSLIPFLLPNSDHNSHFTSLGPDLYFQLVERAVREAQEKRQKEIEEAEEMY